MQENKMVQLLFTEALTCLAFLQISTKGSDFLMWLPSFLLKLSIFSRDSFTVRLYWTLTLVNCISRSLIALPLVVRVSRSSCWHVWVWKREQKKRERGGGGEGEGERQREGESVHGPGIYAYRNEYARSMCSKSHPNYLMQIRGKSAHTHSICLLSCFI